MSIKYVLHTGESVDPKGNKIWIDGDKMARHFGVAMSECLIVNPGKENELAEFITETATHLNAPAAFNLPKI